MISCKLFIQFCGTSIKQLNLLNSKFLYLLLFNHSMDLAEIFSVFYLECLIVPYLFTYYRTAPIQLKELNSNLLQLLLLNCLTRLYQLTSPFLFLSVSVSVCVLKAHCGDLLRTSVLVLQEKPFLYRSMPVNQRLHSNAKQNHKGITYR